MTEFSIMNISIALPEIIIILASLALLVVGAVKGNEFALKQISIAKVVLFAVIFLVLATPSENVMTFNNMFVSNGYTVFCKSLILMGAFLTLYMSIGYYKDHKKLAICEFPVLILLSVVGMMLMVSANSLLALYMGLELQSLALYILAAISRDDKKSSEAGLKYFVLGALSSGIILYGCSLIYGFSGTMNFDALKNIYMAGNVPFGVLIGLIFVIVGISFKVSAVPFHMWTPDVYEGSPMPVTAFFAVAPKIAAVSLFVKFVMNPFGYATGQWQQVIIFLSAASMIIGALGALRQTNIKRLIAYSSIGHVGYILVGLASASNDGAKAILLYLVIYMTLSVGIFASIMMIRRKEGASEDIASFSGLSKTHPVLAMIISVIMLSMAGIPPFAGFFGKFFIFFAAVESGLYVLAVIGVLSSVVAAFYYLRIIKIMYFDEASVSLDSNMQREMRIVSLAAALFNMFFFLGFTPLVNSAAGAVKWLF